jgi:DNA-binding response OmpR family regulator
MPRILIVDDEPNIVISLEYLMKREGFDVATAGDGEAALAALEGGPPDVVILDVMLPKVNGFEVCRRMRADPRWRATKVLMLTAKGRDSEIDKGLGLGADVYVTKPFSTKELLAQVRALLAASGQPGEPIA